MVFSANKMYVLVVVFCKRFFQRKVVYFLNKVLCLVILLSDCNHYGKKKSDLSPRTGSITHLTALEHNPSCGIQSQTHYLLYMLADKFQINYFFECATDDKNKGVQASLALKSTNLNIKLKDTSELRVSLFYVKTQQSKDFTIMRVQLEFTAMVFVRIKVGCDNNSVREFASS